MRKAVIIQVFGRVQGVGFRYFTKITADKHTVYGFVKNKADGSVYVEAEAMQENLDAFIRWIEKGPSWARVDKAIISDTLPLDRTEFLIK
jgi:acylphosphatase